MERQALAAALEPVIFIELAEGSSPETLSLQEPKTKLTHKGGLTLEQQDAIKALVKSRVEALPKAGQAKAAITCWSSITSKFQVKTYKDVAPEHFQSVLSLIARLPLGDEALALAPPEPPQRVMLLPVDQAREIVDRLDRLSMVFHPFNPYAVDVYGIRRALQGCHPRVGTEQRDYVRVLTDKG